PENTAEMRRAVYRLARQLLRARLKAVPPRLPRRVIIRERRALELAIKKVEAQACNSETAKRPKLAARSTRRIRSVLAPPSRQVAAAKSRFAAPRFMLSHVVPRFGLVVFLTVIMIVYRPIAFLPTFLAPHLPPAPVRPPPAEQSRASADQPMPALPQTAND